MKRFAIILLASLPIFVYSQKIRQDEIDKFTKQRRVETSYCSLKEGLGCGLYVYLRSVDTTYFLNIGGHGCAVGIIGTNDHAMFLLENDSTVYVHSTGVQSYDSGEYGKSYRHQYYITLDGLRLLANNKLKSVRRYYAENYADIDIPDKKSDALMKQCALFLTTLNK